MMVIKSRLMGKGIPNDDIEVEKSAIDPYNEYPFTIRVDYIYPRSIWLAVIFTSDSTIKVWASEYIDRNEAETILTHIAFKIHYGKILTYDVGR